MEMGETYEDRHDGGDFGALPPAPPRRDAASAHNGHAAADASATRDSRSSPAMTDRPTTSASVASSVSEHVEDLAVRVAVRARPLVAKERVERARECLSYPKANTVVLGESRAFRFDDAFGPGATQAEVYDRLVSPLVESCFRGYNATVLAYGQTGSGKTYTMGSGSVDLADDDLGIIPRVVADVFAEARARFESGSSDVRVRCAFLEVHNEEVRDLLHPDTNPRRVSIRERADGAIVVAGAREVATSSADEMLRLLELGCVARTTGGTKMNALSSRSHAIFTIIIEQTLLTNDSSKRYASAKFHLVDLAGSERNKKTKATGSRFQESININSGLLALGNVIAALSGDDANRGGGGVSAERTPRTHVPYRDSKLTRLLQDSLGGNSKTCVVACVSPVDTNFEETLNTLKYATRARNIKNTVKVNRDPGGAAVAAYGTEPRETSLATRSRSRESTVDDRASSNAREVSLREQLDAARRQVAELTAASAAKDLALAEARDDLRRDEAIFAEKMREIKALKREAKSVAKASVARNARSAERGPLAKASAETPERGTVPLSPSARPIDPNDPNDSNGVWNGNDEANAQGTLPPLGGALPATPLGEPFGASSPFSDAADAEKRSLVRQKAEIELERAQLRREAARRARAYQQEKKSLERRLRELARNIGSKEKLIVDLTRNEREAALLTRRYEDKVRSLEEEKASKEAEAARLRSELLAIERAARETEKDRSHENDAAAASRDALRDAYEKKVRAAETELRVLRLAKAESDALLANTETLVATEAERKASDKTRELESEIAKMRADAEALRLRLRERERERDASFATEPAYGNSANSAPDANAAAELADLRRERDAQSAKIETLASNESAHLEALRRATDELAAAKATIRRFRLGGEHRGDATTSADSEKRDAFFGADDPDVRALVETETAKALARRERQEERARLNAKRDALLDEKRELFSRRDALLALGARAAEKLRAERATLERSVGAFAVSGGKETLSLSSTGENKNKEETLARLAVVIDALANGRECVLRAEEARELRDAEDRADSVDAEVDFLDAKLAELDRLDGWTGTETSQSRHDGRVSSVASRVFDSNAFFRAENKTTLSPEDGSDAEDFSSLVASMAPAAARAAAAAAMERLVRVGLAKNETAAAAARLEMQLGDAQRAIEEMESASRAREMEFDRRVTELRLEHGRREAALLSLSEKARAEEEKSLRARNVRALRVDETLVDAVVADADATRRRNEELRGVVARLERERAELEGACGALEDKLERSSREAQTLRERVARLVAYDADHRDVITHTHAHAHDSTRRDGGRDPNDVLRSTSEDDAGSLAPEEDDRDDGFGGEEETRRMHSLPTPPRLPATPVGVLRRENVLEAPRFAYPGSDASAPGRGNAGSIRKAAVV